MALYVFRNQIVVGLGNPLDHALTVPAVLVEHLLGHRRFYGRLRGAVAIDQCLAFDQVDDPPVGVFLAYGDLDGHGARAQPESYAVYGALEIGSQPVHLVDEADTGYVVAVCLSPYRLGLRLNARDGVEDDNTAVQNSKTALDLSCEVHVPRGVYDIYGVAVPVAGRRRRRDCDAPLPLLSHPVQSGRALVHTANLVYAACYV